MEIVKAMRELGWENFSFKIIEEVPNENLDNREYYWSQYFDCYNNGYNTNFPKGYNMESQTELRNCKKICQLNNNSEIIAIYNSTREAVKTIFPDATEEEIKTKMKCISAVARGNRKSAYGFKWKYSFKENIN
jgi:hypothetical protein